MAYNEERKWAIRKGDLLIGVYQSKSAASRGFNKWYKGQPEYELAEILFMGDSWKWVSA